MHVGNIDSCIAAPLQAALHLHLHVFNVSVLTGVHHNDEVDSLILDTCLPTGKAGQSPAGVKEIPPSRRKAPDMKKGAVKNNGSIPRAQKVVCY